MSRGNIFTGLIGTIIGAVIASAFFWYHGSSKKEIKENVPFVRQDVAQQQTSPEGEIQSIAKHKGAQDVDEDIQGNKKEGGAEKVGGTIQYVNNNYHYSLLYPEKWEIDISSASEKLADAELSDGRKVQSGGVVFFSNYKNIGDYTPETKPKDMFLVSVVTYSAGGITAHNLSEGLGFMAYDAKDFSGKNIGGNWFFARTTDENNPMVAVIFEKDGLFYVIQPAFVNGNTDVLSGVEEMAKSFEILGG